MKYDLINKRRQEFLLSQKEILRELSFKYEINSYQIWDKLENQILESLKKTILSLNQKYIYKKKIGDVSDLKYINISWMRTGLHTNTDLYRIDFYDDQWVSSLCECAEYWTPPKWFDVLKIYKLNLEKNFERQSVAKIYYLENMIYDSAETLNTLFFVLLKSVLSDQIKTMLPYNYKNLKIYAGEFLDHNDLIYDGQETE